MNEPSLDEIKLRFPSICYDVIAISKQILTRGVAIHLLDDRVFECSFHESSKYLSDGYIMSSAKQSNGILYDLDTVSKYVSVGAPFAFVRSSPATPLLNPRQKRILNDGSDMPLFVTRSGVQRQIFDVAVQVSAHDLESESVPERLARLFYSQLRCLTFAHSFYLKQISDKQIAGPSKLLPALESLIERLKTLVPIEGNAEDRNVCEALKKIILNADVDVSALSSEIEKSLQPSLIWKFLSPVFGYFDKKADIAIEAAARTATKQILTGGL